MLDKGIASTKRELASWHDRGVTAAELTRAKSQVAGTYLVRLSTTLGSIAARLQGHPGHPGPPVPETDPLLPIGETP